jgi:hypothetical protein
VAGRADAARHLRRRPRSQCSNIEVMIDQGLKLASYSNVETSRISRRT